MTVRTETKTTKQSRSSSLVARVTKSTPLICLLFLLPIALLLDHTEAGLSLKKGAGTPNKNYPQPVQYQQQPHKYGSQADYYQQLMTNGGPSMTPRGQGPNTQPNLMYQPAPDAFFMQHKDGYPVQAPGYSTQGQNYPMQPRNYPIQHQPQQQQIPTNVANAGPATGFRPVPVPTLAANQQQRLASGGSLGPGPVPMSTGQQQLRQKLFEPKKGDSCGAIAISEQHGYMVKEYVVTTKDKYKLVVHRLIHPSNVRRMIQDNLDPEGKPPSEEKLRRLEPKLGDKKPYLLLHGLVGSSASFVRNVAKDYQPPQDIFDVSPQIRSILDKRAKENELHWQSSADRVNAAFFGDLSNTVESASLKDKLRNSFKKRTFATSKLIDFYGDQLNFAESFTQAFRKFEMPHDSLKRGFVPNSLAFTLSNFGYDVWLANLRGNEYSKSFEGPLNHNMPEYWDFNLDQIIKEDLLATINHIKSTVGWQDRSKTLGVVTYSYSSLHILGLLTSYPEYQKTLQPVIMMAPTLLSPSDKSYNLNMLIRQATKLLISHTGPFPNRARNKKKLSVEKIVCSLTIASQLCNLMTLILHGQAKSPSTLMLRDSQCGQTSTGVLRQIVQNLSQHAILSKYTPYVSARPKLERGDLRRFVMIIRSQADEIASEAEVNRIKDAAIQRLELSEVVIEEPKFNHADFLFSHKNQFLVNAEVARMALVFDFMSKEESANVKIERPLVG